MNLSDLRANCSYVWGSLEFYFPPAQLFKCRAMFNNIRSRLPPLAADCKAPPWHFLTDPRQQEPGQLHAALNKREN